MISADKFCAVRDRKTIFIDSMYTTSLVNKVLDSSAVTALCRSMEDRRIVPISVSDGTAPVGNTELDGFNISSVGGIVQNCSAHTINCCPIRSGSDAKLKISNISGESGFMKRLTPRLIEIVNT